VVGGNGDDIAGGGAGKDKVIGGAGNDILGGGSGNDRLFGGVGNDELFGGRDNDILIAGAGDDTLNGGHGDDLLRAGPGRDALFGGDGDDILFAENGRAVLSGGKGSDHLYAGTGKDVFVFRSKETQGYMRDPPVFIDYVYDFDPEMDRIRFVMEGPDELDIATIQSTAASLKSGHVGEFTNTFGIFHTVVFEQDGTLLKISNDAYVYVTGTLTVAEVLDNVEIVF